MALALANARVLTDAGWQKGQAVLIDGKNIVAIVPDSEIPAHYDPVDCGGHDLAPGFIDIQVNGGGGVLFNDAPTVDGIRMIAGAHRRFGTTGLLPTLISDDLAVIARAIEAVDAAIESGVPGILGIHIEGPFLSMDKKGIHDPAKFRTIDEEAFTLLTSLKRGVTHVTLAPEVTTPEMITCLSAAGIIVSAGHTNATYEQTEAALRAGMHGFTHLYNAMSPLQSRAPGVVGAALADATSFAGIIADSHHVHAGALKAAFRAKGADRLMLVTDAMPSVGAENKSFILQGRPITVVDGKCTGAGGTLAGSDLDMAAAVRNATLMLGIPLEVAVQMASRTPAAFLGLEKKYGSIRVGQRASLVLMDKTQTVHRVFTEGTDHGEM